MGIKRFRSLSSNLNRLAFVLTGRLVLLLVLLLIPKGAFLHYWLTRLSRSQRRAIAKQFERFSLLWQQTRTPKTWNRQGRHHLAAGAGCLCEVLHRLANGVFLFVDFVAHGVLILEQSLVGHH